VGKGGREVVGMMDGGDIYEGFFVALIERFYYIGDCVVYFIWGFLFVWG
jgi:hypothetical protein